MASGLGLWPNGLAHVAVVALMDITFLDGLGRPGKFIPQKTRNLIPNYIRGRESWIWSQFFR